MTIASTTARNDYLGNGATAIYPYTFMAFLVSDIVVAMADTLGNQTTLILGTDYTIDVVGPSYPSGGNVSLLTSVTLPAGVLPANYVLSIVRNIPLTQPTSIRNQRDFYPEVHENEFDRLLAQIQQATNGNVLIPLTEVGPMVLPPKAQRALQFLGFDVTGAPIAALPLAGVPATPFAATILAAANSIAAMAALSPPIVFSFLNNQSAPANVTGLLVAGSAPGVGGLGAAIYRANVRLTGGGAELCSIVTLKLVYRQTGTTWAIAGGPEYDGDDLSAILTFSITAGGQVQYTSTNSGYSGKGTFTLKEAWYA